MSKTFEVGVIIEGIDRVTKPIRGITAAIRKMSMTAEKDSAKSNGRIAKATQKTARDTGGVFSSALGSGWGKVLNVAPQIAAVTIGVTSLYEGYQKVTGAADDAAKAQLRLNNAILKQKGGTQAQADELADLAGELQNATTMDDEFFMNSAASLARFGIQAKQIKALLPALGDYVADQAGVNATSEDGIAAAKLIGKAWAGNTGALRKQGIVLSKSQELILKHGTAAQRTAVIIRAIEGRMGGMAEQLAKTPEGMKVAWQNQLGEIEESLGRVFTPFRNAAVKLGYQTLPYLQKFADALPSLFTRGAAIFKSGWAKVFGWVSKGFSGANTGGFLKSFSSWGPLLARTFKPIIPVLRSMTAWIYKTVGSIGKWMVNLWQNSQPGLRAIAEAFKPIIDVVRNLWYKVLLPLWDGVLEPLLGWLTGSFVPALVNVIGPAIKGIVGVVARLINNQIDLFTKLFGYFRAGWKVITNFFSNLWEKIRPGWTTFKMAFEHGWKTLFGGLFDWLAEKWGGFLDLLKKIGQAFGLVSSDPVPSTASSGGNAQSPPRLSGKLEVPRVPPLDAMRGYIDGTLHINYTHDGQGKVTHRKEGALDRVRFGVQTIPH